MRRHPNERAVTPQPERIAIAARLLKQVHVGRCDLFHTAILSQKREPIVTNEPNTKQGASLWPVYLIAGLMLFIVVRSCVPDQGSSNAPSIATREPTPIAIDDTTLCSTAVQAFDQNEKSSISAIDAYVDKIMRQADNDHIVRGEPGIIRRFSRDGYASTRTVAVEFCRQQPSHTVKVEAADAYEGARGIKENLGGMAANNPTVMPAVTKENFVGCKAISQLLAAGQAITNSDGDAGAALVNSGQCFLLPKGTKVRLKIADAQADDPTVVCVGIAGHPACLWVPTNILDEE